MSKLRNPIEGKWSLKRVKEIILFLNETMIQG